jgi:hypothetical protein
MHRTAWLAATALTLAPGVALAQYGGMGGMGGGMGGAGMGGGFGPVESRRAVQVEMEGGRRLSGQIGLGNLWVYGELGQYQIHPDKIKMIRFLKPANEPRDEDGDDQPPVAAALVPAPPPGGGNMNAQMMMRRANPNNVMNGQQSTVRAKVILNSGEEIIGHIQVGNGVGFRLEVDYGTMIPATDKLRTMTFGEVEKKTGSAGPDAARPRAAGDDRDASAAVPQYFRHGPALVVRPHGGGRITLYNMESKQSLELSGPEDGPLEVVPIQGQDFMALGLRGPKITRIAVADNASGWHIQDLRQPAEGSVMPIVGPGVAVYRAGRYVYAYGVEAHRWDVAELPEGLRASPVVGPQGATIEGGGHIYTFAARTGKWEHINVKAILDIAGAERK